MTFQAQVLGKGSIHPEFQQQRSSSGNLADDVFGAAAAAAGGSSGAGKKGLATHSWSPAMRSPFKDALQRISRKVGLDRVSQADGLQSQPSDVLPKMQFLQRAAVSLRSEQQRQPHHGRRAGGHTQGAPEPPIAPSGGSGALHTVVEVRGASLEGAKVEAAAAAARQAIAGMPGRSQVQQGADAGSRGASFELRATDVVLGNSSLRQRVLGGQQQGETGSSAGSPRVGATAGAHGAQEGSEFGEVGYAEGFVPRSGRPIMGAAGQLAKSSSIKRRSANYS
jgi:hypothetical protein